MPNKKIAVLGGGTCSYDGSRYDVKGPYCNMYEMPQFKSNMQKFLTHVQLRRPERSPDR
jgi:hypothetical protein